ncbi:MAG: VanZ family protein [Acidimicrobiales bacterium]
MHILGYRVPELVVVGILAGLALGLAVGLLAHRRGPGATRLLGLSGLTFFVAFVLSVTLAPSGRSFSSSCSLVLPADTLSWSDDQRMLNLLLFVPLGLFAVLAVADRGQRVAVPIALVGLSAAVEVLQNTAFVARSCDLTDLFDNGVGSVAGAALGALVVGGLSLIDYQGRRTQPVPSRT